MVKVLQTGLYATIQDLGRFGQRCFGVPVSGVMDRYSGELANALLGNHKSAAVLEMTMTGAKLQFLKPTTIAITGALMAPKLNGEQIDMFKSVSVGANAVLCFGKPSLGCRTYLAVNGGFDTQNILGSRSMALGITKMVRLQTGDLLPVVNRSNTPNPKYAKLKWNMSHLNTGILEVKKGPEFSQLKLSQQHFLLGNDYQVSKYNNRMAYQLEPLMPNNLKPILTSPVLPGTVQLTPSGQLIVLMRDCQTTGGYPRVLQLTEEAINSLAQKFTGNSLKIRLKG